jgi:glucose 1-dehydrogenase
VLVEGKTAVVTGAGRGIGLACSRRLAKEGADLVLVERDADAGRAAAQELLSTGRRVELVIADVGYKDDVGRVFELAKRAFGGVDILVANAGIHLTGNFLDVTEADYDAVLRTNLKSVFLCGQAAARLMVEQGRSGSIVNMSSINAVVVNPDAIPYAMSKGGVNQLTKAMAIALSPYRIRVNALGPGTILTDLARDSVLKDADSHERILSRTPLGRLGTPEEVAAAAVFLASEEASYITGQTIYVDGGRLGLNYTVPTRTLPGS